MVDDDDDSYLKELIRLRQKAAASVSNLNRSLMEVAYVDVSKRKEGLVKSEQTESICAHRKNSIMSLASSIYDDLSEEDEA